MVGDGATFKGATGNLGNLNVDNLKSLTLKSGTNTSTNSSSSKTNSQTASINTAGNVSLGASTQNSSSQGSSTTQVNTNLNVDSLSGHADTTIINGGVIDISGTNAGSYSTGKLYIETVQNTSESSNKSSGANIGINLSGGAPTGGSLGANKANGNAQSITAAEQSAIIDRGDKQSFKAGDTTNIGGIMANFQTDSEGNQSSGTLNFTTDTLTTKDIINTATNDQRNLGGSIGVGTGKQGQSINNLGVQIGHTANEFESVTKATIGQGAIVTSDTSTGQNSLAGVNRDPFNTEIIIKDQQTAGLSVDANIDARVFTGAGRTQIANEQKDIGKNTKKVGAITIADAVKVPAIIAAVTDKGNKNPDSQNKSTFDKAKDNVAVINNINHTGMSDDTAELNAKIEKIEEGGITNEIVKQVELNQLKDDFAKGTDAEDATVYINPDLTKSRNGELGTVVLGSANETTGKDIYLDSGALNMSDGITIANGNIAPIGDTYNNANTLTEEITHSNGQGEASASKMGNLGEIAYNVGKWANNGDIAEAKGNIDTTAINSANTAQEQQEMLATNKKRLETQQAAGDAFENVAETVWDAANVVIGAHSLGKNVSNENYGSAAVDAVGIVVDTVATVVPFVPGGAGTAIKAGRAIDNATDVISTGRTVPKNLKEKLAMKEVKSNPKGYTPPKMPKMSDTKNGLLHEDGWVKRVQNVNGVEIHYVENTKTGKTIDFKFKD